MNGLDFLDGLSDVDMKYIAEADERPAGHVVKWQYFMSLAACFALTVFSGVMLIFGNGSDTSSVETTDGLASMISSSTGLLWMTATAGVLGMIVSVVLIIKCPNGQPEKGKNYQ